jgi:hypothetical protein
MYWIDFGIYHVATPPESSAEFCKQLQRSQRLRITHLRLLNKAEIENKAVFLSRLQQACGGGLIGGPIPQVRSIFAYYDAHYETISKWTLDRQ